MKYVLMKLCYVLLLPGKEEIYWKSFRIIFKNIYLAVSGTSLLQALLDKDRGKGIEGKVTTNKCSPVWR